MRNATAPSKETKRLKDSGGMHTKSKGSTNALSKPVPSHMAPKAPSTSTTNSNTLKSTLLSPTYSQSLAPPNPSPKILKKSNPQTFWSKIQVLKSTAYWKNWAISKVLDRSGFRNLNTIWKIARRISKINVKTSCKNGHKLRREWAPKRVSSVFSKKRNQQSLMTVHSNWKEAQGLLRNGSSTFELDFP